MKLWNGNEGILRNCEILEKGNLEILGKIVGLGAAGDPRELDEDNRGEVGEMKDTFVLQGCFGVTEWSLLKRADTRLRRVVSGIRSS